MTDREMHIVRLKENDIPYKEEKLTITAEHRHGKVIYHYDEKGRCYKISGNK